MTKSRWSAAALLIAIFVVGALAGGALVGATRHGAQSWRSRGGPVESLARDLDLTAEQRDSIGAILGRHHEEFRQLRDQIGQEIRAQLRVDQQARYDSLMVQRHRRVRPDPDRQRTPEDRSE